MAQEAAPIDINHNPPTLQDATETVVTTRQRVLIQRDGKPVAYLVPADQTAQQAAVRRSPRAGHRKGAKSYTLESAFGAVTDTGGPHDFDQMIRAAKDERADRLLDTL